MNRTNKLVLKILGASIIASSIVSFISGTLVYDVPLEFCDLLIQFILTTISIMIIYGGFCILFMYYNNQLNDCEKDIELKDDTDEKDDNNFSHNHDSDNYEIFMDIKFNELLNKNILMHIGNYTIAINNIQDFIHEVGTMSKNELNKFLIILRKHIHDDDHYTNIEKIILESVECNTCIAICKSTEDLFRTIYTNNVFGIKIIMNGIHVHYHVTYQNDIDYKYDFRRGYEVIRYEPIQIHFINALVLLEYAFKKGYIIQDSFRFKYCEDFNESYKQDIYSFCKTHFGPNTIPISNAIEDFEKLIGFNMSEVCDKYRDRKTLEYRRYVDGNI